MKIMTRGFMAGVALMMTGGLASAADVSSPEISVWDGFYLGVHGGYATGDFTNFDGDDFDNCWYCDGDYGSDMDGFLGGVTAGYNYSIGNILVGVEGELGLSDISGSETDDADGKVAPYQGETDVTIDYYGTITGRLGYSVDRILFYGKAGWGFVNTDIDWQDKGYGATASGGELQGGFVFGGGIEFAFSDSLSVKAEYLRFQLGDSETMDVKDDEYFGYQQKVEVEPLNTFKIGLNYHF